MYTLITFATQWGSKFGGINSFNADFLTAFSFAYHHSVEIVCIVAECSTEQIDEAAKAHVTLLPLPYAPKAKTFDSSIGEASVALIKKLHTDVDPHQTIWLGHDLISGGAAVTAAMIAGGHSAVIHHMSYDDYESYAEDSESAHSKTETQSAIFENADIVLAIGPLLRDAAMDRLGRSKRVHMVIPGLPEIDSKEAPKTFVAFLSGRLTSNAARIKQGNLGIAAFAAAERRARAEGGPDALRKQPKLILRGVDFDDRLSESALKTKHDPETELKEFADEYGGGVINLHTLPYTEDRKQLYAELSGSSVALMPSWHEGFGLVGWEAIAAGVPLIIGQNTGLYRLLEEEYTGAETGYVYPIDIKGQTGFPYFRPEDLDDLAAAIREVATDPVKARKKASTLRNMLLEKNTWASCSEHVAEAFGWDLQRGSLTDRTSEILQEISEPIPSAEIPKASNFGPLKIPQGQWHPQAGMADSQLLRAEEALLPFDVRREPELETLRTWIADPTWPITVRLVTGAGGEGKTRLAIHLCEQLITEGWHAGFLDSNLEPGQMNGLWRDLYALNQPIMVVVDYAETKQTALLSLLRSALENPAGKPVRMLLLARDGGEWWDNLPSKDPRCESLLSGYATTGPFRLNPLYTQQNDRNQAFTKALTAFADILHVETPEVSPDLIGDQFERPLFIQMAALLTLYGERPLTTQGLTKALLNHERRYWIGLLASFNWLDPGRRAEQLLALATLTGGIPTSRFGESLWKVAKGSALTTGEFNSLFRNMATLYPGTTGLQALRPDILGEALVSQALLRPEGDVLLDAVLSTAATQFVRRNALTVLARLSNERADVNEIIVMGLSRQLPNCASDVIAVSTETVSRLPELAQLAFEHLSSGLKSQVAGLLRQFLPDESVQLARLQSSVYAHLFERAYERHNNKPGNLERLFEYGQSAYNYAIALYDIGNYKRAYEVNEKALLIFQPLITKDRDRFEPMYLMSLVNHANNLHEMGQMNEALPQSKAALEIYERLTQKNPDRFEPGYATSLNNYARDLSEVGQYDEARARAHDAMEISHRLAQKNPDRFEPDYATSLSNYAGHLSDQGEYEEALANARQALEIRHRLAQKNPDRFEPDYAASLSNYASHLSNLDQHDEALVNAFRALEIRHRLARKNPDRFEPEYATSLNNYASFLNDAGQYLPALENAYQALEIRHRLTQKNPDRFEPEYAKSLSIYATSLNDLGEYDRALENARKALNVRQQLAQKNPDRFEPDYATSLSNYASYLTDSGLYTQARVDARKALELHQRLAEKQPKKFSAIAFANLCFLHFLNWLCEGNNGPFDNSEGGQLSARSPDERKLVQLYSEFVQAVTANEQKNRTDSFRSVRLIWTDLSAKRQRSGEPYRLCAEAWLAKYDSSTESDWKIDWQNFSRNRNNHLPHWMLEVTRRLEFQFPQGSRDL